MAWEEFSAHPSIETYGVLLKYVPRGERAVWHGKSLFILARADLRSRIEFLRKSGFMPGFARIVQGAGEEPSCLARAKEKWKLRNAR